MVQEVQTKHISSPGENQGEPSNGARGDVLGAISPFMFRLSDIVFVKGNVQFEGPMIAVGIHRATVIVLVQYPYWGHCFIGVSNHRRE